MKLSVALWWSTRETLGFCERREEREVGREGRRGRWGEKGGEKKEDKLMVHKGRNQLVINHLGLRVLLTHPVTGYSWGITGKTMNNRLRV